jgi:hypothetical protein
VTPKTGVETRFGMLPCNCDSDVFGVVSSSLEMPGICYIFEDIPYMSSVDIGE